MAAAVPAASFGRVLMANLLTGGVLYSVAILKCSCYAKVLHYKVAIKIRSVCSENKTQ
jgi:hypothetical protein